MVARGPLPPGFGLRMRMAAVTVVAACMGAVAPPAAVHAATEHTFSGLDPQNPHTWMAVKNWSTEAIPRPGDRVVIRNARVDDVPVSIALDSVYMSEGAELASGGPLITDTLLLHCGRLAIDTEVRGNATVIGGELRPASGRITLTNRGVLTVRTPQFSDQGCGPTVPIEGGVLKLYAGARVLNRGTITGSNGEIQGMVCCTSPQVLENAPGGRIDASDTLTFTSLRLLQRGLVRNGTLWLDGGDHVFQDGTTLSGADVIAVGSVISVEPTSTGARSTVNLANSARLVLQGEGELFGTAAWAGNGSIRFDQGSIHGDQQIDGGVTFRTNGSAAKRITRFGAGDPGTVVIDGIADLGSGPLTVGGTLTVRKGRLMVKAGEHPVITGTSCCAAPVPTVRNRGRIEIAGGADLTIASMRLDSNGTVVGAGALILDGGDHRLRGGNTLDAPVTIRDGAIVRVGATTTVKRTVDQLAGTTLQGGTGTTIPTIGGTGTWAWRGGDIAGNVEFAKDLSVRITGDQLKRTTSSDGRVGIAGPSRIEGPGELRLNWGSSFVTSGPVTLAGAVIRGSSCCTDPANVRMDGALKVVKAAGASLISNVNATFRGAVDLNGGVLTVDALDPSFESTATLRLEGGHLEGDGVVLVGRNASLIGPGTVTAGVLAMNGTARFATRGTLTVEGGYQQGRSGTLALRRAGATWDKVVVRSAAWLAGRLALSGNVSTVSRPTVLMSMTSRTGTFTVTGLPAGKLIAYDSTTVRILP